jgi:hypothetical protein
MKRCEVTATLVLLVSTVLGCAHTVDWDPIEHETPLGPQSPGKVSLFMDVGLANAEHSFRAFGSGIANKWLVPYGERVHYFAEAYLTGAFRKYEEVESPQVSSGMLVHITDVVYTVSGQAAHVKVSVEASDALGDPLLTRSYSADGPSGAGAVFAGGAFAQKGMVRRSTNRALHAVFQQLIPDLQSAAPR